jgi:hypothetical protein
MVQQQQQQQQKQYDQHNVHSYSAACDSWQQQQQQHSSPFPSLSGTSYTGTPMMQQQHLLRGVAAGAGVEGIPRELKAMAPLRRHQQYLGTT